MATNFPRHVLKELLLLCIQTLCFIFNGDLYKHIDGVAMGSLLDFVFAYIFMHQIETKYHNFCNSFYCWYRYVDDIFCVFSYEPNMQVLLNVLNSLHINLKFTIKTETAHVFHFLDVNIKYDNNRFCSQTYFKPTNTGLYMLWDSFLPYSYKINLIKCVLLSTFKICSNWPQFIHKSKPNKKCFYKIRLF